MGIWSILVEARRAVASTVEQFGQLQQRAVPLQRAVLLSGGTAAINLVPKHQKLSDTPPLTLYQTTRHQFPQRQTLPWSEVPPWRW